MARGLTQVDQGLYAAGIITIDNSQDPTDDTIPDPFGWPSQTDNVVDSVVTSIEQTPVGYDASTPISVDVGLYSAGGANFTAVPGVLNPGEHVTLRHDASPDPLTAVVQTCTIGGVEGTFQSTTEAGENPVAPIASGTFNPPDGRIGVAYSYGTVGLFTGGAPTSYSLNGTLPDGLTLNTSTGLISGTPTTEETLVGISVTGTNGVGSDTTNTADIDITVPGTGSWQLPVGNYVPAGITMVAVYPRPDNETSANSRHRLAHSGFEYQLPIGVKSGAFPYRYSLTGGGNPAGATIGEELDIDVEGVQTAGEFYGVVRWSPPGSGTFNFEVTVEDQEGTTVVLTWEVVINDAKFTFMAQSGSPSGAGTIGDPIDDWDTYYKQSESDNTYQDQLLVLRGGAYTLDGNQAGGNTSPNKCQLNSNKGNTVIGFPGESPIVDCSNSFIVLSGVGADSFIGDIRFENGNEAMLNTKFIVYSSGRCSRSTVWKCEFANSNGGVNGTSNAGAVWWDVLNVSPANAYIYASQCTFDNLTGKGKGNTHYFDEYNCEDLLWERNIALANCNTDYGFWNKAGRSRRTVRMNTHLGSGVGFVEAASTSGDAPEEWYDTEICYNLGLMAPADGDNNFIGYWQNSDNINRQMFMYRNSWVGAKTKIQKPGTLLFPVDGNVVVSDNSSEFSGNPAFWDTSLMDQTIIGLTGNFAANIVDPATGKLTAGAIRNQYLGIQGFEIAS